MTTQELYIGDSKKMKRVKDCSISLVVSSPPYWNLKEYSNLGVEAENAYEMYIRNIEQVLIEVERVLKPGRFACINVGTAVSKDYMEHIPSDIISIMKKFGFKFKKEIIWMKPKGTQGLWQRGVTKYLKKEPYPCYFSVNIMHEYILIFQKNGDMDLTFTEEDRLSEEFIKQVAWSVWQIPVSKTKGHPAPFPLELPMRLIKLYSKRGETVLDPFGGSGTTMEAAIQTGRSSVLYEINPEYGELIKTQTRWGDHRFLEHINFVFEEVGYED